MSVQLILLEDVADLGKIGDEVHVAKGYARNYLLPLKKAELLTINARRRAEAKQNGEMMHDEVDNCILDARGLLCCLFHLGCTARTINFDLV